MDPDDTLETTETEEAIPSSRELIEEAFDAAETEDAPAEINAEESVVAAGEAPARERDEHGRFAKKADEPVETIEKPAETGVQPAESARAPDGRDGDLPVAAAPEVKAPQSWNPAEREHWGALSPEVKQAVMRREADVQGAFQQTAEARKVATDFHQVYAPYEAMIRSEGSNPMQAAANLFQTAGLLRTGTPMQKAQVACDIVKNFAVDVGMLDRLLVTGPRAAPTPGVAPGAPFQDPRVDQLMAALQAQATTDTTARNEMAAGEVTAFMEGKEFFGDVRETMADLIELSSRRNIDLTLDQAYTQACKLNPDIAKVIDQRERATAAGAAQQRGLRTRRAASSVTGAPAGAPPRTGGPSTRREALEEAFDSASGD